MLRNAYYVTDFEDTTMIHARLYLIRSRWKYPKRIPSGPIGVSTRKPPNFRILARNHSSLPRPIDRRGL